MANYTTSWIKKLMSILLNYEKVEEAIKFIKENMFAVIKFYKGEAFSVEAPNFVELLITQADPGVKEKHSYKCYETSYIRNWSSCKCTNVR